MNTEIANNIAIIVAAGTGSRCVDGMPKQFLNIKGKTILRRVVERFVGHEYIDSTVVVINDNHIDMYKKSVEGLEVLPYVIGGSTRQKSVSHALKAIEKYAPQNVLIHDAARIFIDDETISKLVSELDKSNAAIAATRVKDTIKHAKHGSIEATKDRENMFLAQTPQAFKYDIISMLHDKYSGENFTDDSSLCEKENINVKIIETSMENFKITTKDDFELAEKIIG